jgi:prophage tail gpP-like protein
VTDHWVGPNGQPQRLEITPGAVCRLEIAGQRVITGYVDSVTPSYSGQAHTIAVSGRDAAGDLCDCSAQVTEWKGLKLEAIVAALAKPYGIGVTVQEGLDTGDLFARYAINAGDSVQESIERLARQRGLLVWSDAVGGLVIGTGMVGAPVATLRRGQQITQASGSNDHSQRFSQITVMQSKEGGGADVWSDSATTVAQSIGVAQDPEMTRYRPLVIIPETQTSTLTMGERAEWERRVRAGKGRQFRLTLRGWFADPANQASLWRPGQTVVFDDDWLGADGDYLISAVRFDLTEGGGSLTALTLVPPDALDILAEKEKAKKGSGDAEIWQ